LPQQLPGPAQLASPGDWPQQAESPGPGSLVLLLPDMDEWGDKSLCISKLPQNGQVAVSPPPIISSSLDLPHFWHT
jgi:hypothetical protein